MSMGKSKFEVESPERVVRQAEEFRQTFRNVIPLPESANKSMYVEKVADWNVKEIQYSIERAKYQNSLFRKLEKIDIKNRNKISQSLLLRDDKIQKNLQNNHEKQHKKHEQYSKHVVQVQKRYGEQEKKKFLQEKQEAIKLRKELKEFYQKQEVRKKQAQLRQIKVQTCYSNALQRISRIQKTNEEFAQKAQLQLQTSFTKNSPTKNDLIKLRSTSFDFRKNQQIYQQKQEFLKQKELDFIQKVARNETVSIKAFERKQEDNEKVKKRISEKIKKDIEKWKEEKKRADERKAEIPVKCTSKLEKSLQSTFRNTFSTFRGSFCKWRNTGEFNRSTIKQKDDRRKNQIMGIHEDITLLNKSSKQVEEKMLSMKQRASKVAADFL